ncbi:MAG: ACT domain-containing protein [Verrucomicrobiota bacterium]
MHQTLIITLLGSDRPGLVEAVSNAINGTGGNWESSRLARLGGQFAGMVQLTIAKDKIEQLDKALNELEKDGLKVSVIHSDGHVSESPAVESERALLSVVGLDRKGIVSAISSALAREGANVDELATECREAPWTGEQHFQADFTLSLPDSLDRESITEAIEAFGDDLMIEWTEV